MRAVLVALFLLFGTPILAVQPDDCAMAAGLFSGAGGSTVAGPAVAGPAEISGFASWRFAGGVRMDTDDFLSSGLTGGFALSSALVAGREAAAASLLRCAFARSV